MPRCRCCADVMFCPTNVHRVRKFWEVLNLWYQLLRCKYTPHTCLYTADARKGGYNCACARMMYRLQRCCFTTVPMQPVRAEKLWKAQHLLKQTAYLCVICFSASLSFCLRYNEIKKKRHSWDGTTAAQLKLMAGCSITSWTGSGSAGKLNRPRMPTKAKTLVRGRNLPSTDKHVT